MKLKDAPFLPLNLQFFAEGSDNGGEGGTDDNDTGSSSAGTEDQNSGKNDNSGEEKTFTQAEVNAIGANEKKQGKNAILKMFGCADEKSAKAQAEAFKKWQEEQKTDEEKKSEAEQKLKDSAAESNKRAEAAENKLTAIEVGVSKDCIDDVLALALPKVTEEKDLKSVLEEMKKNARYSLFFGSDSSGGTGTGAGHQRQNSKGSVAARLAKNSAAASTQKSNFFKSN